MACFAAQYTQIIDQNKSKVAYHNTEGDSLAII